VFIHYHLVDQYRAFYWPMLIEIRATAGIMVQFIGRTENVDLTRGKLN